MSGVLPADEVAEEMQDRLKALPKTGRDEWADQYGEDVPVLLGIIAKLRLGLVDPSEAWPSDTELRDRLFAAVKRGRADSAKTAAQALIDRMVQVSGQLAAAHDVIRRLCELGDTLHDAVAPMPVRWSNGALPSTGEANYLMSADTEWLAYRTGTDLRAVLDAADATPTEAHDGE